MTEIAAQPTTDTTTDNELQALEADRSRLALAVREGVAGADKELRAVERKLAELARQRDLATLAEQEAQRLEAEERKRDAAAERQEQLQQLERLGAQRDQLLADVEARIDAVMQPMAELNRVARAHHQLAAQLRREYPWRLNTQLDHYIDDRIGARSERYRRARTRIEPDEVDASVVMESLPSRPIPAPSTSRESRWAEAPLTLPSEGLRSTRPAIEEPSQ